MNGRRETVVNFDIGPLHGVDGQDIRVIIAKVVHFYDVHWFNKPPLPRTQ